ncbi:hypothetical protein [Paenibacillus durus]|uniref:Uncharacterized protein n=1 Tax=Paenibacillus durus TaxID=44251 RepID=A0A089HXZ3_PAEDU|nr:hypothetical protein [Paenibacillus durus]AIQ15258.1 hypothetical protein PDUR_27895 [Paenibacillus durus]
MNPTINFPTTFFTDQRLSQMWAYTRYFLAYNQKLVMILVALIVAGMVAVLIVGIGAEARRKDSKDNDDDDVDFDYY